MLVCVFILCTLREKSLENGETGRSWKGVKGERGGAQGFLNDAVSLLTSAHSYIYPPLRDDTHERGGGVSVSTVQLRLVSYTYILTQGGRLYRRGNNATGVPERFHYTASRGIISRDISPRSTPMGVKFRATGPPRMKDEPSVWRPHTGGASPWATPLEGERFWRAREEIAATDHTGARDRHAATENGRWLRGDRKYEGAVLITLPGNNGLRHFWLLPILSRSYRKSDAWRTQQYVTDVVYFFS